MPVTMKLVSPSIKKTTVTKFAQATHISLKQSCKKESQECEKVLQSSAEANLEGSKILTSANCFFKTAISSYNMHHHLTIRPEDVWFAILSQLSVWSNANAAGAKEALGEFIAHEREKYLTFIREKNNDLMGKDFTDVIRELEKDVTDPNLREWIMPSFTTTTTKDAMIAWFHIIGFTPKPSGYLGPAESVTLLGEQSDWEKIHKKLYKLATLGDEPTKFAMLLAPIVLRFIESFQNPTSKNIASFWRHFITVGFQGTGGVDSVESEGWISVFYFWNKKGRMNDSRNIEHIQSRGGRGFNLDGVIHHIFAPWKILSDYTSL